MRAAIPSTKQISQDQKLRIPNELLISSLTLSLAMAQRKGMGTTSRVLFFLRLWKVELYFEHPPSFCFNIIYPNFYLQTCFSPLFWALFYPQRIERQHFLCLCWLQAWAWCEGRWAWSLGAVCVLTSHRWGVSHSVLATACPSWACITCWPPHHGLHVVTNSVSFLSQLGGLFPSASIFRLFWMLLVTDGAAGDSKVLSLGLLVAVSLSGSLQSTRIH